MKPVLLTICALWLCGCTAHPEPIIDTRGVNMAAYEADLEECRSYSQQIRTSKGVAKGAAGGAAVGGVLGAIDGDDIGEDAGVGAVFGGVSSGLDAERTKQRVVKNCLRGRGYRVLN